MEQLDLDMLGVYAYTDSSHARERELWRGFLSYALPVVMSTNSSFIDSCLTESIVYHLDELTARGGHDVDYHESMRCISVMLAKEIGESPEFGLASFFEGELPTKLYQIEKKPKKKGKKGKQEDQVIAHWLSHLARIQKDNKFLTQVEKWKTWLTPWQPEKVG